MVVVVVVAVVVARVMVVVLAVVAVVVVAVVVAVVRVVVAVVAGIGGRGLVVRVAVLVEHGHDGLRGRQPAAHRRLEAEGVVVHRQAGENGRDGHGVGAGVHQRCHRHVAGGACEAVEPGGAAAFGAHRNILATAQAAPNPLSMPTTVTPLAHEACIASSAVTPSRPAP